MQNEIHDFSLVSDHVTVVMNDWNMTTYINLWFKEEIKTGEPALNGSKIAWAFTDVTIGWDKAKAADCQIGQIHKIHFNRDFSSRKYNRESFLEIHSLVYIVLHSVKSIYIHFTYYPDM